MAGSKNCQLQQSEIRYKKGQKLFELYSPELVTAQFEYLTAKTTGNSILQKSG